jgi:hypothetical protein
MMKAANAEAMPCPTCPHGRCPFINTRPDCPEPDAQRISDAEHAIPDVLAELFQHKGQHSAIASQLVEALGRPEFGGHRPPAAKWAVHGLITKGMLSVHTAYKRIHFESDRRKGPLLLNDGQQPVARRPIQPPASVPYKYGDDPADFATFIVRAEEGLWSWWRGQADASSAGVNRERVPLSSSPSASGTDRTYSPRQLCKEFDITSPTLNKYAKAAGVKVPGKGKRNFRYSTEDRLCVLRKIAETAPTEESDRAAKLLAKIEAKSNEEGTDIA